ncbi:MAG: hypothetical protein ACXWEY_10900 [Bacteroidia bacterium]
MYFKEIKNICFFVSLLLSAVSCKQNIEYKYPYGKDFYGDYDTSFSLAYAGIRFYPDSIYMYNAGGCLSSVFDSGYFHVSNDTIKFNSLFKNRKDLKLDDQTQIRTISHEIYLRNKDKIYIVKDSFGGFDTSYYWKKRSTNLN